jgi:hypothetical protein
MDKKTAYTRHPMEEMIPEETKQHFRAAREEFRKSMEWMIPRGFIEHRRNARREMLLAWRSMIDARISKMDQAAREDVGKKKDKTE